jgi:hypothetical protein
MENLHKKPEANGRPMMAQTAIGPPKAKRDPALVGDSLCLSTPKTSRTAEAGSEKCRSYKPLPKRFRHDGFDYRQIAREANAAIYKQISNGCFNPAVCYEVIRIRHREGFQIGGRFVEPAEVYPNSEAWGVDSWTIEDKEAAFRKLREAVVERAGTFRGKRSGAMPTTLL